MTLARCWFLHVTPTLTRCRLVFLFLAVFRRSCFDVLFHLNVQHRSFLSLLLARSLKSVRIPFIKREPLFIFASTIRCCQ